MDDELGSDSSFDWGSFLGNTATNIVAAALPKPSVAQPPNSLPAGAGSSAPQPVAVKKDNTMLYVTIGGGFMVLIVVILALKK